uniref:Uncharacterized protein n=1 Tax=Tanacetum cinerariifolium TaxID=118510 RepID=A0A6L2KF26_TANCI|nr:hypothetical protein [Tanacetum cinerariifolium]
MLGTYEEKPKMKMKVTKRWLKDTFEAVPEDISEDVIAPYVRGYLLYLIGTKVLPNCDKPTYYPIGSINDASLNSEIRDEDQETSPFCNGKTTANKRFSLQAYLTFIILCIHDCRYFQWGTQCNFGKALNIALRRGTQYVWVLIIGSINEASLNSEIRDEDQETSPFCNDDQIGSINDASLNPEIRDDAGSSMSPKLKKRVIKVRPDLNVNIARGRDKKTPKSIFSPS